jgi:serine phosphatase RsbU (regulator of sigma subunit)
VPSTITPFVKPATGILGWIQDAWVSVSSLGVEEGDTPYFSRKVVLTNQVAVIIFIVGLIQIGGFLAIGSPPPTINWFLLLLVVVWSVPFLNFLDNRVASRYVLSLALPLFSVIFVGHIRGLHPESVHDASIYVPRYFQIALSFIPVILFGFEEKKHLFISFSLNVLVLLLYNEIMELMGAGLGVAEPTIRDPFFVSVSSVFALAVLSTGYFFLNKMNSQYEVQIEGLLEKTEQQNRKMQDAVNYAMNIQQVVLPKDNVLAKLEDRLFVMYKPLHTVSGDFYMVEESKDHIVFAVIDCTGHGVPGAFMSILASSAIQRSIDLVGFDKPEVILNNANRLFHEDLSRSGNPEIQDGMDMVLCSYDKNKSILNAAGANLMIHVVNGGSIAEYRTDKGGISIGKPERTFKPLSIPVNPGAQIFISTDGYYDQFGGERNKRIGRARYRQLLEETSQLPIKERHERLVTFFEDWKGDQFQIDDVCVIGFRC